MIIPTTLKHVTAPRAGTLCPVATMNDFYSMQHLLDRICGH